MMTSSCPLTEGLLLPVIGCFYHMLDGPAVLSKWRSIEEQHCEHGFHGALLSSPNFCFRRWKGEPCVMHFPRSLLVTLAVGYQSRTCRQLNYRWWKGLTSSQHSLSSIKNFTYICLKDVLDAKFLKGKGL